MNENNFGGNNWQGSCDEVGGLVNVASLCYFVVIFQGAVSHIYIQRPYGRQQKLSNHINLASCHCIIMATTNLRRFVTYTKIEKSNMFKYFELSPAANFFFSNYSTEM